MTTLATGVTSTKVNVTNIVENAPVRVNDTCKGFIDVLDKVALQTASVLLN